jgi:hypothetical protein
MKPTCIFTLLCILSITFLSCKKTTDSEIQIYNGIDSQILEIVDSLIIYTPQDSPFITVRFLVIPKDSCVVEVFNSALIPAPPMPHEPKKEVLISEYEDFIGYKKYRDFFLVFFENKLNKKADIFVEKDSLLIDEEPFIKYNVYDYGNVPKLTKGCMPIEETYYINDKDSLVLVFIEEITY